MTNAAYCVRADGGLHARAFQNGGYAAIGWALGDLSDIPPGDSAELGIRYDATYPEDGNWRRGQNIGQLSKFAWDLQVGDVIVTPTEDSEYLLVGIVDSTYYYEVTEDCPFGHRRRVKWSKEKVLRSSLSVPGQHTLRTPRTVFEVRPPDELLRLLGKEVPTPKPIEHTEKSITSMVIERLLDLDADEFEILVTELLTTLGFEAEKTGKTGDGGVDVQGTLAVYNFATVDLYVQVKRYKPSSKINFKTIREMRAAVPEKVQAAFVTTGGYDSKARQEAERIGFKRIGLIDGDQLVDILVDEYEGLSEELRHKIGLRRVLVPK